MAQTFIVRGPVSSMEPNAMHKIVCTLFPQRPDRVCMQILISDDECPLFSVAELWVAVRFLKSSKAPGPDGIPGETIKVLQKHEQLFLDTYNVCMPTRVFPAG